MSEPERDAWWLRAQMVRVMLSIALAGGFLAGVLYAGLGGPGVFAAPVVLLLSGGFWLFLRPPAGPR